MAEFSLRSNRWDGERAFEAIAQEKSLRCFENPAEERMADIVVGHDHFDVGTLLRRGLVQ